MQEQTTPIKIVLDADCGRVRLSIMYLCYKKDFYPGFLLSYKVFKSENSQDWNCLQHDYRLV